MFQIDLEQCREQSAQAIGIEHFGAHDLRTCAKLCRKNGGDLVIME